MRLYSVETRKRSRSRSGFTVDRGFRAHLIGFNLSRLGASRDTVYVVDKELQIRGFNHTFERSARRLDDRDWLRHYGLGFPVLEGFTSFYGDHYGRIYLRCLAEGVSHTAVYGCATPLAFRWYRESVKPLAGGAGLLITHRLLASTRRSEAPCFDQKVHRNADGLVLQCCHCERIRNIELENRWEWLPDLPADLELGLSHGLCPHCLDTYYGDLIPEQD